MIMLSRSWAFLRYIMFQTQKGKEEVQAIRTKNNKKYVAGNIYSRTHTLGEKSTQIEYSSRKMA